MSLWKYFISQDGEDQSSSCSGGASSSSGGDSIISSSGSGGESSGSGGDGIIVSSSSSNALTTTSTSSGRRSRMAANLWVLLGLGVAGIYIFRRNLNLLGGGPPSRDKHGAFVYQLELRPPPPPAPPRAPPPLTGLTFAVKDMFDIEDHVTGFGCPAWAESHPPAVRTAHAVSELVKAGATCVGKTHLDELAMNILGNNFHYGTPDNPAAPGRFSGGSSSGSAVAVAGGHADFALGTDTCGSVRVPAALCGVLGFRPTHGAVSTVGVLPVAHAVDTVGWFAKDALTLRSVGQVLLGSAYSDARLPRRLVIADDLFKLPSGTQQEQQQRVVTVVERSVEKLFGKAALSRASVGAYLAGRIPALLGDGEQQQQNYKGPEVGVAALRAVRDALFRLCSFEFRSNHEEWIEETKPKLGPHTADRVREALSVKADGLLTAARQVKADVEAALQALLKPDTVLVLPTVPAGPPPRMKARPAVLEEFRDHAFTLLSLASMSGCCQVTVPLAKLVDGGLPGSVSLLARPGADHLLLDTVVALYGTLQEQAANAAAGAAAGGAPAAPGTNGAVNSAAAEAAKDLGNAAFKKHDYAGAVKQYSEAIKLDGSNPNYYTNRAMAHMRLSNFKEVVADCGKAIGLDRKSVKAYFRRGKAREYLGYYKEAEQDYLQVLVLEPTNRETREALDVLQKSLYQPF